MKKIILLSYLSVTGCFLAACESGDNGNSSTPSINSSSSSSVSAPLAEWIPTGKATNLPQLSIQTNDDAPIVSKEIYMPGSFELTDIDATAVQGELNIRGRGNSTWDWPKKPYRIKLAESVSLLGMPASRHWVLLANFADKTLIRNDLAFAMSRAMAVEYTVNDRHIELYVNDQYQGVYQLVEQIRLAGSRLDLPELDVDDTDPQVITGSYLLEVDFRLAKDLCNSPNASVIFPACINGVNTEREQTFCVDSLHGMSPICVKDPNDFLSDERQAQRDYIEQYITDMEAALYSSAFTDSELGYSVYLDRASAVDYYLINEFFKNVDGGTASFFLHKKRDGKLHFGPIWDFDFAMGNVSYSTVHTTDGWHIRETPWFTRLFEDPIFAQHVNDRWNELKNQGLFEQLFQYISARSVWLENKQRDNFSRWASVDGVPMFSWRSWFNATLQLPGNYAGEVAKLLDWQKARYRWMDQQFNGN